MERDRLITEFSVRIGLDVSLLITSDDPEGDVEQMAEFLVRELELDLADDAELENFIKERVLKLARVDDSVDVRVEETLANDVQVERNF